MDINGPLNFLELSKKSILKDYFSEKLKKAVIMIMEMKDSELFYEGLSKLVDKIFISIKTEEIEKNIDKNLLLIK